MHPCPRERDSADTKNLAISIGWPIEQNLGRTWEPLREFKICHLFLRRLPHEWLVCCAVPCETGSQAVTVSINVTVLHD